MNAKPRPEFTMDELLAELREQMPEFADGEVMTTAEMAATLGISESTMRRRLKVLKGAGAIRVVRKQVQAINDRWQTTTAWAVVQQSSGSRGEPSDSSGAPSAES